MNDIECSSLIQSENDEEQGNYYTHYYYYWRMVSDNKCARSEIIIE